MERYHITGGKRLFGTLRTAGAKNAALPILAATLLSKEPCRICNCPDLSDVRTMMEILHSLGCKVSREGDAVLVDPSTVNCFAIPEHLMQGMRSSVFLMGPLLVRMGEVAIGRPGGCTIGQRPIDIHLSALMSLGMEIQRREDRLYCSAGHLEGAEISFQVPSVGATENAMLAAVGAHGVTHITGAAREPEITDLQDFLNACGAQVQGAGSDRITIRGTGLLSGAEYSVIPDRIEGGTFLCAAAITGGELLLTHARPEHLEAATQALKQAGCKIESGPDTIWLKAPKRLSALHSLRTQPYPGFPTDLQSQFTSLMAAARGTTEITETIFENRFKTAGELEKMGACIRVEGRTAFVAGVKKLHGARLRAEDLRGGAALVLAALGARGESIVENICHINRGYDKFDVALRKIGADIRLESDE